MREADRATWRKKAEECVDLARFTTDGDTRRLLLTRAQELLRLAYSEGDTEFERALSTFNKEQMASGSQARPATRQQPRQQQQSKSQRGASRS